ncbi:uncharacterized protein LOC107632370 [Arachis ipaensis]|uniref:uncharacterized protein LOC107632370 n=1 Tax=Arachis ipaensis TaxID=130454 RepID=UPI0007AF76C7|nr:uncharacterized protein LOC107632370 [Arachis ipaensis]
MIADDSGVDIGASEPAGAGGGSSSGTQQYPPHFSSLDFDAMRQEGVPGEPAGFGARDAEGSAGLTEFQLVAIAQDGNSNILPVTFALVEDRHNGIKAMLEAPDGGWLPLAAYRAFCIRYVTANFALTFKGKDARRLLVNATYAKTEVEFDYWFDILRSEDPAMCEWENRIEYSLWTQHRDEGRRFGHMTTNISECVNSILKGVRNLPVCSLVKATYGRLAELFVRKGREAEAQLGTEQQFSQHLGKCIEANMKTARCFTVTLYDRDNSEFIVSETTPTGSFSLGSYRVSLAYQTCDCGYFQELHFPCPHALACCAYSRLTWQPYVHQVYRLSSVFNVYRIGFTPPIPEDFWPPYDGLTVIPDPTRGVQARDVA